jgi:hypothetical protein
MDSFVPKMYQDLGSQDGCTTEEGEPLHEKLRDRFGGLFMLAYILLSLGSN